MDELWIYLSLFVFAPIAISLIVTLVLYVKSPFKYPYWSRSFNVTGTKQPKIEDYIDQYLIDNHLSEIDKHVVGLNKWKEDCNNKIKKSLFRRRRQEQYETSLDYNRTFSFSFIRNKTRYKQVNYVRYPYTVTDKTAEYHCGYSYLKDRYDKLKEIGFEAVLSAYHSKKQRSLMTKELRDQIAFRDNFTCQICGKYMPDGVGLHIDHTIPVSKGGKSVPSNLQVLCSKCNGKKSKKINAE